MLCNNLTYKINLRTEADIKLSLFSFYQLYYLADPKEIYFFNNKHLFGILSIHSFLLLKDGRLALSCSKKTEKIQIYDLSNNYSLDINIEDLKEAVYGLSELDNNYLISFSFEQQNIWKITKSTYILLHTMSETINLRIGISENRIILGNKGNLKVWDCAEFKESPIKEFTIEGEVERIRYVSKNNIFIGKTYKNQYHFVSLKSFQTFCIFYCDKSNLIDVIGNKLYIKTQKGIIIFDIEKYVIEKEVINEQLSRIQLVVQIRNNVLLCANTEKQLMIWERKNEKIRIISISIMKPINMIMVDRNAVIYINECKEIKCISI